MNIYDELGQVQRVYRNKQQPDILLFKVAVNDFADRRFYPFIKPPMMEFADFFNDTFLMAPMSWHSLVDSKSPRIELDWDDITDEVREEVQRVVLV